MDAWERKAIDDVLAGDPASFQILVRANQDAVLSLCVSVLRSQAEAEDAAQEIFLKAFHRLRSFRHDAAFSTWLYRIAYNHCLDLRRQAHRRREQSWEAQVEQQGDAAHPFDEMPDPVLAAIDPRLQQALDRLPPDYRLILILREVQELSYDDIASVLHTSLDGVKARLKRARAALQEEARHFWQADNVPSSGATR